MSSNDYHTQEDEEPESETQTEYTPKKNTGKKPGSGKKGFYIALAVCLAAVGVAGWTTYDSVHQYRKATADTVQTIASGVPSEQASLPAMSSMMPQPSSQAASSVPASTAPAAVKPKKSVPAAAEIVTKLQQPVKDAAVQASFSETPVYSKTLRDWRAHTGMDLSAAKGAAVTAAADGTVKAVSKSDSMGGEVIVAHTGGLTTIYSGLDDIAVKKGDTVCAGNKLGTVGVVPYEASEASHLHFSVQKDGAFVDPALYLK